MSIALLTDFGESEYIGIMKGVIRKIAPKADIIDLTHSITSHKIIEAAWVLYKSYRFFPKGTIFCVVVDPGVGTERQAIVIETKKYKFIGPDNGVLWQAAVDDGIEGVVALNTENASPTFHGRDVFAPAAAKLIAKSQDPLSLGMPTKLQQRLDLVPLTPNRGVVVRIDNFGNIITNLPKPITSATLEIRFGKIKETHKMKFCQTFAKGPFNQPFAIIGSSETIEIALRNGRAANLFDVQAGTAVELL
ncbi:MAG: S-adenosyl-l-methionine hydroxide adenosyltransferase family protein [Candidatus Hodarchaeota archaeon]